MYQTLAEVYLHTQDDILAEIVKDIDLDDDGEGEEIYAVITAYFLGWFKGNPVGKKPEFSWAADELFDHLLRVSDAEWNALNNVMHILHVYNKGKGWDLRQHVWDSMPIRYIAEYFGVELPEMRAYPTYEGCAIIGGAEVPKEWKREILKATSDLEVSLNIHMTWLYSHMSCGDNYRYDRAEDICVEITGATKGTCEEAFRRINGMHFVA